MIKITSSRLFDNFVLFLIVLSCGFMVFDHPSNIKQVYIVGFHVIFHLPNHMMVFPGVPVFLSREYVAGLVEISLEYFW